MTLNESIGRFNVRKTLRFEMKPLGKTAENLAAFLAEDEDRAAFLNTVKTLIEAEHLALVRRVFNSLPDLSVAIGFEHRLGLEGRKAAVGKLVQTARIMSLEESLGATRFSKDVKVEAKHTPTRQNAPVAAPARRIPYGTSGGRSRTSTASAARTAYT